MLLNLDSGNAKLGKCATTYAPIRNTCPDSCPLRSGGCYAMGGRTAIHLRRLETCLEGVGPLVMASLEASEVADGARHLRAQGVIRPLRLHTFGDCRTPEAAALLADACRAWPGPVWTYTHAWRDVPRRHWGAVSVLASVESLEDAERAWGANYAPAIVVDRHPDDGRAWRSPSGMRVIPCPNQTRDVTCDQCRLCFDDVRLHASRSVIAFAAHGSTRKRALTVLK